MADNKLAALTAGPRSIELWNRLSEDAVLKNEIDRSGEFGKGTPEDGEGCIVRAVANGIRKAHGTNQGERGTPRTNLPFPGGKTKGQEMHGHGKFRLRANLFAWALQPQCRIALF